MLDVSHLTRRYGTFVAVDDCSFRIGRGEIVGLLGHNGAGKTTIMKMLSGYLEPDQGRILIDGIDLAEQPQKARRLIGYLPESLPLYPELPVAEYLDYAAGLKGIPAGERAGEIRRVVAATDLGEKLLAPISTLSRGQKQRVGVAQAILGNPRLLILDEPTNGLDPAQTQQMRELIRNLAREATVILSTHIMQEVEALCDRVLIIRAGRLVVDQTLEAVRRADTLLLECNLDPDRLRTLLTKHDGITLAAQRSGDQGHAYRLRVSDPAALPDAVAALCRTLVAADAAIYRIAPEQRDLEQLFREANEQEELADVA